jgi:hypothetical protein
MQTSVFKLPISPVISGQNIIDDLNELDDLDSFGNRFSLAHLDFTDFTERDITIDGKLDESFFEVSMDDTMEVSMDDTMELHTLWEEEDWQDGKREEPLADTKDMVSTEPEKEKDSSGFLTFDNIYNKTTVRDRMEFKLSRSFNDTTKDYARSFSKVGHVSLLVENNNTDTGFITVDNIIKSLVKHMVMANEGALCHTWTYRERECYALLDWMGCWNLYAIAPRKYVDDARPRTYNDHPVNVLAWDDNNYMYNVVLDLKTDVMLPNLETDEALPGSTFKDLSYCKAYVNMFVDGIRRGN